MKNLKTAFLDGVKAAESGFSPKIEINSDREAVVFGCRGILEYSPERIRLVTSRATVRINGSGLLITSMDKAAVAVTGVISSIEFLT